MIREIFSGDYFLWSCLWQSTLLIVAGLAGSFILRHRSSRAHRVLFLSMIAAVIVPAMSILVKHYELGLFVAKPVVIQSPAEDLTTTSYYKNSTVFSTEGTEYKPGPIEKNLPSVASGSENIKIPWRSIFLYGWIAISLLLAARLLVTFVLGVRILGRSLPLHCERIEQAIHLAGAKLGIDKDVNVYGSQRVRSPLIWCWKRRPILLVPGTAGKFDNRVDWIGILCHELAHYKRRDHISGLLAELVVCILPWHPLLWWAKSRLVRLSEQACDDWVVAAGRPSTDYAESLLDLTPGGQMAFVPAVMRSKKGLAGRIRRILQNKCSNPRTGAVWALAVSIVTLCLVVGIAFAQTRPANMDEAKIATPQVPEELKNNTLPADWTLDYDDGLLPDGGKRWLGQMAENLASLKFVPKPAKPLDTSRKDEKYDFRVHSLQGEHVGQITLTLESKHTGSNLIILKPDKYSLKYERKWGRPGDNFRMTCGKLLVDLSRPGMYELKFTPKLGAAEITGSLGGCYAINFERVGKEPCIRGFAYQDPDPGKRYILDGLPAGKYRLSAVTQQRGSSVFVTQAEVRVEAKEKVTVNIMPAPMDSCFLKGYILGKQKKYKTPWSIWPESEGEWFLLIRKPGSAAVQRVDAYEALTMDTLYVVRRPSIVQETKDRARYQIEGVAPGRYTVTAIENPSWSGCVVTRQQSKPVALKANQKAVLDFDLRGTKQGEKSLSAETDSRKAEESGNVDARFELGKDIAVELDAGPHGMRKIVHAKSIRFDKAGSDIKVSLRADVRKGLRFEWRTRIELLGVRGIILDQRDTLNNSGSLVSGQPVVEERVIEFPPFKQDEVANARRFRIRFEQAGPLLDELGRPYDADRTDWIRGRVTGPDGQPVVDAIVLINEHKPKGGPFRVPRVGTDEKGYYRFGAVDWPYRISVEHKQPVPSTNIDCYQILHLKRIFKGPQEIDFQFHEPPKGTTSLVGRVVDTKEVPIRKFTANVSIADGLSEIYSEDANDADEDFVKSIWFNQEVKNEDGVFRLDNIPAGKYRIRIIPKEKKYEWKRQEVVLADNKTTNLVLEVSSKHVLYGRVLFEDGSPAVIKPEPWPGARTRIIVPLGSRARGLADVEEDGYFTAYLNETELERLKSTGSSLIINVPTAQQGRSKTVGRFPFELLATEKNKAGTVKVRRPETKPLSMSDETSPEVDLRGTKQVKDNPSSEQADKKAEESRNVEVRVVHFPADRSLGKLSVQDTARLRRITYWFHWGDPTEWEYLCEARGDVHVPAGKRLNLTIRPTALRDLSPLTRLRPDDLHGIAFEDTPRYQTRATDECMTHIARLTGLKSLTLRQTNITDKGIRYIGNLKSLEHLVLPDRVTDRGMAYVGELNSLKRLYFSIIDGSSQVTNTGLRYLAKLTNLEELALIGERMGDAGLVYIKDLPRLEYLFVRGSHFGDNGMVHVKNIPSLRILSFHEGIAHITDAGLAHISDLPKLESLCLHGMSDITDEGLAYLAKMPSLKKLEIGSSQVTDKGLRYLAQIKTLERLELPQEQKGITDKGLTCLGQLPNLKHLSISRIHYNDPKMNKEYYTDKGLAELTRCRLLEELHIGSIGITDAGMEHIVRLTNLKKLMLFGCDNLTDAGLAKLTALKSLKNLSITDADISIEGLNNFKPMPDLTNLKVYDLQRNSAILDLSALTALEDLSLNLRPRTQDEFVDADLVGLANLNKLKWMQIGPRNYTDKGMAYLAGLTDMERLGIGGAGLTDEGIKYLTNMKKLNHLSILGKFDPNKRDFTSGGNITDKGLRYLEEIKSLSFLNIYSENTFSTPALRSLQRELPNLFYLMVNGRNALGRTNLTGMDQQSPAISQPARSTQTRPEKPVAASENETKPAMSLYRTADYSNIASGNTTKVLHFPPDQSVGVVYTQDEDLFIPETVKGFHPGYSYAERENFCPARGEVRIPPGKRVILTIRGIGATPNRFRKALETLGPDDLYGLEFFFLSPIHIDDDLMALIGRLKGLKILNLHCVRVTPKGLALVSQLPQLEHLFTPRGMNDAGMAELAKIQPLKDLNVFFDRMTNEGLRSLGKLTSLEVLFLYGNPKMTDDGLKALTQLRSLKHLRLGQEGSFTDRGMEHLAAMPSLKVLWLDTHNVTDEGLRRLAQSRSLERLCICWLDKITDRGISYLTAMPQFKGLNAMHLKLLTDAMMAHLATMPNIDDLRLPYGFTDAGINHLANLDHLKYLWVNCADNSPLTDKSLATISNLRRLEELHISGTGFTNEGIKLLRNLQNLTTLHIAFSSGLDNETLKLFAGLPKLRDLSWSSSDNVTMSGLSELNNLAGLESLSVHDIRQDDGGLDLSGLKRLSRLRIMTRHHATRVGNEFVTTWDEYHDSDLMSLSGLANLEHLSFAGPGIGDAGLKHLASLTNLKYLEIGGGANLTDDGLRYLTNMRRLDSLFIGDSRIAGQGLAHLYPLKTLHIIRITSTIPVSGKAIARLRTELPHLQALDISRPQPPVRLRTSRPRGRP